jgi:hypothetical protein
MDLLTANVRLGFPTEKVTKRIGKIIIIIIIIAETLS